MKILRRHRGFTTNSSSASEWIDPDRPPASIPLDQFDAMGNRIPSTTPPSDTPPEAQGDGGPATISLEGFEFNPFATPSPQPEAPSAPEATATATPPEETLPSVASENTAMVLGFLGAVLGVFALERLIRLWLRKRKEVEED